MMANEPIQYDVGDFEGPLDLLLSLVQRHQVDIYDVSISEIIDQYLATIEKWEQDRMAIASEFIVMASRLIKIKSRRLLPSTNQESEDEVDDEAVLIRQLADYKQIKAASLVIEKRYEQKSGSVYRDPLYLPELSQKKWDPELKIKPEKLGSTFARMMRRYQEAHTYRTIPRPEPDRYTVEHQEAVITRSLKEHAELTFRNVIQHHEASEVTTSFFAVLELYKKGRIEMAQQRNFGEMQLKEKECDEDKNQ